MKIIYIFRGIRLIISGTILLYFILISENLFSQRFEWVNFTPIISGNPNSGSGGEALTMDNEGNIYTMASFSEPVMAGEDTIVPFFPGSTDIYLTKWNPEGLVLWAKPFGGSWYDNALDLAFDQDNGRIYASCHIQGTETVLTDTIYTNSGDYQILFFDTDGNFINNRFVGWSNIAIAIHDEVIYYSENWNTIRRIDPEGDIIFSLSPNSVTGYFFFNSVGITPDNDLLAAGIFSGSFVIGDDTVTSVPAPSGEHTFLLKANSSGQVIFAKYIGSLNMTYTQQIPLASDDLGNTYLSDNYSHDGLIFGNDTLPFSETNLAGFIAKFDNAGNALWGKHFYGTMGTYPYDITFQDGNIFSCGSYYGQLFFGDFALPYIGNLLGYVIKMDTLGDYLSAKELGSYNGSSWAARIGAGSNDHYFLTGMTYGGGSNSVFGCFTQAYSCQFLTGFKDTVAIIPEVTISQENTQLVSSDNCSCSIQWYLNENPIEGATGENLVVTENGDYYCIVQDDYNCSDQSNTITVTNTGSIELLSSPVTISPNPFSSVVTIDFQEMPVNETYSMTIMDLSGQIVYLVKGKELFNKKIITSNLSTLNNGIYILEIISGKGRMARKLVKI